MQTLEIPSIVPFSINTTHTQASTNKINKLYDVEKEDDTRTLYRTSKKGHKVLKNWND